VPPKSKTVITVISKVGQRPASTPACLVMLYGLDLGKKYNLDKATVIIGRSAKSDIQVDQESVSRSHAKITNDGQKVIIRDLGSTNGTYVNDELVEEKVLRDQDFIKIGRTIFKFLSGGNIENAYHEEIYRLTTMDGLTQVYNKRYFMETLEREISRSRRYGRELSLLIYDIDHFKNINDSFGHLAGDFILKSMSEVVKAHVRREDFLARYGGEEFAIILPEIDHDRAMMMGEKIRRLVQEHTFNFEGTAIPVTVSVGVATLDDSMSEGLDFIKQADGKLYIAKGAGRNRVSG